MMKIFTGNKGSVSVFLVIILIPVLVVCGVFVDTSRMMLARSLALSAGELTLNTALTYYDKDLNDYYGLLASSQSLEEFYGNAESYFAACMKSQGMNPTDAGQWAESLRQIIEGDKEINDLMQINVDSLAVTPYPNANMANATMIKAGIVDFMKYRAPVELLQGVTGLASKFTQVDKKKDVIPVETDLQDKKLKYYEAEGELMEKAGDIYLDMLEYKALGITEEWLKEVKQYLDELETEYDKLHNRLTKELYNGENRDIMKSVEDSVVTNPSATNSYSTGSPASQSAVSSAISNAQSKISSYNDKKEALQTKLNTVAFKSSTNYYDIQYWIQMEDAIKSEYEAFIKSANEMFVARANLQNAYNNRKKETKTETTTEVVDGKEVTTTTETETDPIEEAYGDSYNQIITEIGTCQSGMGNLEIYKISNKLEQISTDAVNKQKMKSADVTAKLAEITKKIEGYQTIIDKGMGLLTEIQKQSGELQTLVKNYEETYDTWKGAVDKNEKLGTSKDAAGNVKSTIVEQDIEDIKAIEGRSDEDPNQENGGLARIQLTQDDVTLFTNRMNAINALLGTYNVAIDDFTYHGTSVLKIKTYAQLKSAAGKAPGKVEKSSIPVDKDALEQYTKDTFSFIKPEPDRYHNITANNNPGFHEDSPGSLVLHNWLHDKFDQKAMTEKSTGKKEKEKLQKTFDDKKAEYEEEAEKEASNVSGKEIRENLPLPSQNKGGEAIRHGNTGDGTAGVAKVTGIFDGIDLADILKAGRDNLYATQYIMSMLSYETYEKEGKYRLAKTDDSNDDIYAVKDGKKISPFNCDEIYAQYADEWKSQDTMVTYNKTLTNKMINMENNYSYGNEVEYILYGSANSNNKFYAQGTMYAIRFALDIAPVFQYYWSDPAVNFIAEGVFIATCGIVPIPLVKLIICLGITAAEAALDLCYLKAGLPVLFFKKENQLFLSLENIGNQVSGIKDKNPSINGTEIVFSYSDYLSLFVFIALCINQESIYLRTADTIQCNLQQITKDGSYLLQNANTYYELKADIKVNPMMLGMPWARSEGADVLNSSAWNTFTLDQIRGY